MSHQNSKGGLASVFPYGPEAHHNKPEEHPDTMPSDYQPPGVDEEPPHITIHEKMYRLAIEKHNPLGSEGFQGGSEEIHI